MNKPDIAEIMSEPLYKMAIADLEPGEDQDNSSWDYSHLLPKGTGLQLFVTPGKDIIYTHVQDEAGKHVGNIQAHKEMDVKGNTHIEPHSDLHEDYHGQGIGKAMYEALYAHAYHKMGIKHVSGGFHSEDAGRVHEALARKHGLNYKAATLPKLNRFKQDNEDEGVSRGPYQYVLKTAEGDTSFNFGANAEPDPLHQQALRSVARMHPDKQKMARDWIAFVHGKSNTRPVIHPDLERHLARFGIVDPAGYQYTEAGRSLARPMGGPKVAPKAPGARRVQQPEGLRNYRGLDADYFLPYQKAEDGFLSVSPDVFESAIAKHPDQTNLENPRDYEGKKTFLSHDQTHGYALHGDELTNVFSTAPGGGSKAVRHAVLNGARKLSAFDGHLPTFYSKFGFKEVRREPNWTAGGPDVVHMELPGLAKGLLGAALAAGVMSQTAPDYRLANAFNRAQQAPQYALDAAKESGIPALPPKWTPTGLHNDLIPIAHLESSFGLNMLHEPNAKGEYHTAYGALGFKPSTAHEEWQKTKQLQKLYPGLEAPEAFMKKMREDHQFYNTVASAHFARLKQRHGTPTKAAYAWRWGSTAAQKADDTTIANDDYVKKYHNLSLQTGIKPSIVPTIKSEELAKMAIRDLPPGEDMSTEGTDHRFDYSSHLTPKLRKEGYKLHVAYDPKVKGLSASIKNKAGHTVGNVFAGLEPGQVAIQNTHLENEHRGKGLGTLAYQAVITHAFNHHNAKYVVGDEHSTLAHEVHERLSAKHKLDYNAEKIAPTSHGGESDGAYGEYEYRIK